jgi:hypothetical protein
LCGIEPKPAARRGGAVGIDGDGRIDDLTHAVAQLEIGPRRRRRKTGRKRCRNCEMAQRRRHLWISVPVP